MVQCQECGLQVCVCGKAYKQYTASQLVDMITQATHELGDRTSIKAPPKAYEPKIWEPLSVELLVKDITGWQIRLSPSAAKSIGLPEEEHRAVVRGVKPFDQNGMGIVGYKIYATLGSDLSRAIEFSTGEVYRQYICNDWVEMKELSVFRRIRRSQPAVRQTPPLSGEDFDALTGGLSGMFKQPRKSQEELDKLYDEVCKPGAKFKFEVRPGEWCRVVDVLRTESPSGNLWTRMDVLIFNPYAGPDMPNEVEATITIIREPEEGKSPDNGYVTLDSIELLTPSSASWSRHDNRGLVRRTIGQVKGFFSDNSGMKPDAEAKFNLLQIVGTKFKLQDGFLLGGGVVMPSSQQIIQVHACMGTDESGTILSLEVNVLGGGDNGESVIVPLVVAKRSHPKSCLHQSGVFLDVDNINIVE